MTSKKPMRAEKCAVDGCEAEYHSRGWCYRHYYRWSTYGDPHGGGPSRFRGDPAASLAYRTEWEGDCLIWRGSVTQKGYGQVSVNGRRVMAHRFAYEMANGPIPQGMVIDHICHRRRCCNPAHLRLATSAENSRNRVGPLAKKTGPKYRNVYAKGSGYQVQIRKDGVLHIVGTYSNMEEAIRAAEDGRRKLFGRFAGSGQLHAPKNVRVVEVAS